MPDAIVFIGPTIPRADAAVLLDADFRPPVAQGDVLRAVAEAPKAIGIVDGFFENVPAVWHKEVLYALTQGVHVYGAASMGALRAAELAAFGMVGVGAIFDAYMDGRLNDDDEVAVTHGPAEIGYPILSEAMVNLRRTLSDALDAGVVGTTTRQTLERLAKGLNYRDRTYARLLQVAAAAGLPADELAAFKAWLPDGRADQKREDAEALLRRMAADLAEPWTPFKPIFPFEHTTHFDRALSDAVGGGSPLLPTPGMRR